MSLLPRTFIQKRKIQNHFAYGRTKAEPCTTKNGIAGNPSGNLRLDLDALNNSAFTGAVFCHIRGGQMHDR
jgi:hypothetical protein